MDGALLTDDSMVELHPLSVGDDGELGRSDTGVFVGLPPEGVAVIRWLQAGLPLGAVKTRFTQAYGQEPDLQAFIDGIGDCGFVRRIDGRPWPDGAGAAAPPTRGWRLLGGLPRERVAWLLSRPMLALYAAIWLAVPLLFALRPDLLPSAADAWVHPRVMMNLVVLTLFGWVLVVGHELAHLLAARAVGCSGALAISHRLIYLVAQTDLSGLRAVPRRLRYAPILAGMTWDLALVLVCLLLRIAGVPSPLPGLIVYLLTIAIVFQFAFFMRTDVYYVVANWLRLGNLMQDTRAWISNRLHRLAGRAEPHDLRAVPARELRIVRWYAAFYSLGVAVVVGQFLVLGLPLLVRFLTEALAGIRSGPGSVAFWDGAAWLAVTALYFGTLGLVTWRERRAGRALAVA